MRYKEETEPMLPSGALTCNNCGEGPLVVRILQDYIAYIECHNCWKIFSLGYDPCYKDYRK